MPGGIDVRYRIVDDDAIADGLQVLSPAERARAGRFVFARDRSLFIAAHVLLRRTLSEHAGAPPGEWTFVENAFGKPSLDARHAATGLVFNIAHTHGLVACAVGRDVEIGIDVEVLRPEMPGLDIAQRFFSPAERTALEACVPAGRPARFTEIWTLKEAYVKAVGQGLSHALDTFSFAFDAGGLSFTPPPDDSASWHIALFVPTPRHRLALAVSGTEIGPPVARRDDGGGELTPVYTCAVQPRG